MSYEMRLLAAAWRISRIEKSSCHHIVGFDYDVDRLRYKSVQPPPATNGKLIPRRRPQNRSPP